MEKLEGFTQTMLDRNMKPSFRIVSKYLRMAGNLYGNMFGIKPEEPIFILSACVMLTEIRFLWRNYIYRII